MSEACAPGAALPIVVVTVGVDEHALDACLAALDVATPAGTRVWLADNAQGGPRVRAVVDAWLATTRMQAEYGRRPQALRGAAHVAQVLDACGDADVCVLAGDARPSPGWLLRMTRDLADAPDAATVTPWCNAGETAAWPRTGDLAPMPADPARLAAALREAALPPAPLPAAVEHAALLSGTWRRRVGGIDAESYTSWYAALIDFSLRAAAFGARNLLCLQAHVSRPVEGHPADGDLDRLAARWPHWNAMLADALMHDLLRAQRERLAPVVARHAMGDAAQADLFAAHVP